METVINSANHGCKTSLRPNQYLGDLVRFLKLLIRSDQKLVFMVTAKEQLQLLDLYRLGRALIKRVFGQLGLTDDYHAARDGQPL